MEGDKYNAVAEATQRVGAAALEAAARIKAVAPSLREMTEIQKRTLSWTYAVRYGNKHSYEGTVPQNIIDKRRAKNKQARKSRRINRKAA